MTPKSLLRHPKAVSRLEELATGSFHRLLDDASAARSPGDVRRVVLCSGKVYYDLLAGAEKREVRDVALLRVEQLYPFPSEEISDALAAYADATELFWVQEEPENAGGWRHARPFLDALAGDRTIRYVGRPERASPAEGYASDHEREQGRIVSEALADPPPKKRASTGRRSGSRTRKAST